MTLEKILVSGNLFYSKYPFARFQLNYPVDKEKRVPVRKNGTDLVNIVNTHIGKITIWNAPSIRKDTTRRLRRKRTAPDSVSHYCFTDALVAGLAL